MTAASPARPKRAGSRPSSAISHFPFPLSERELARLWQNQTFPPQALVTNQGERMRVIYRGRPGAGAGPDFRDAVIAAPGGLLQGDVELHLRSSDFRRHGHDRDPAYAEVALHLVFRDDEGTPTALPGGREAVVVALGDWARGRAAEIERWLERPALWREPCFSALSRLGVAEVRATLERLGEMRLRQKAATFAKEIRNRRLEGAGRAEADEKSKTEDDSQLVVSYSGFSLSHPAAEQVLWEAILQALAYGSAREQFRLLAERLPWGELRGRLVAIPSRERSREAEWLLAGGAAGIPSFGRGGGRPAARPQRRLQGAAQLAARFAGSGLLTAFLDLLDGASENIRRDEARSEVPKHGYAKRGLELDARAAARLVTALTVPGLIGRSRAVEVAGNAVLPCLAALGPEARTRRAEAVFGRLPLPDRYGAVRHLHEAVGGQPDGENGDSKMEGEPVGFRLSNLDARRERRATGVRVDFRRQQGMLYLLRHYCTQGGCGRCPLS